MTLASCMICVSDYSLDDFRSFDCGHCFCGECAGRILETTNSRGHANCPTCRQQVRKGDLRRVYLDIVDPRNVVIDGLDRMGRDSKLVSVTKAKDKLRKEADKLSGEYAELLLRAVDDFRDRIIPIFTKVEIQADDIADLQSQLKSSISLNEDLSKQLELLESQMDEIKALKKDLRREQRSTEKALVLAEKAKDDLLALRLSHAEVEKRSTTLEEDNARMRDQLERHVESSKEQHKKNKAQKKKIEALIAECNELHAQKAAQPDPPSGEDQNRDPNSAADVFLEFDDDEPQSFPRQTKVHSSSSRVSASVCYPAFEALPQQTFSNCQQSKSTGRKRKFGDTENQDVKRGNKFAIALDKKGHPLGAVQCGPKRTRRVV
ncbi:hypothetical protein BDN72DRAFT_837653 [Pluteus cervinus]|uniref:Uncharacterized protein n=1 Tax=Pluteus cervinus TaxID=181527 RepID=A0ACD3B0C0_9AGAR|nr:hypothetical protein BDN72DRAFT_837653 [Pluteus cervinus]